MSIPVDPNLRPLGSLSREHANRVRNNSRFLVDRCMGTIRSHGGRLDSRIEVPIVCDNPDCDCVHRMVLPEYCPPILVKVTPSGSGYYTEYNGAYLL